MGQNLMEFLLDNLNEKIVNRKSAKKELVYWEEGLDEKLKHLDNLEEARAIFQKASQVTQSQLSEQISGIVSSALAAVFPNPYTFVVNFVSRRNTTECDLKFKRNERLFDPLSSCGYGVADIASLALRVAYWKLDDNSQNTLILDEPTRALSLDKHERASMMIRELSKMENGLQFLIVTHSKKMATYADKVFRVEKTNDISEVIEIENN